MRVTIIPPDGMVYVEGQALAVDCSSIDPSIHAIQWYDTIGEIEFKTDDTTNTRQPNAKITDISPFQHVIDLWQAVPKK
jgi:hypothetical protein